MTVQTGAFTQQTAQQANLTAAVPITAAGAIDPHTSQVYVITNAAATALTLAAPTSGTDDGVTITVFSATAYAHTITATGLFQDGSGNVNVLTFGAHAGALAKFRAYQGKWQVLIELSATMT